MRFINFTIVKLALFLVSGILCAHIKPEWPFLAILPFFVILLVIFWFSSRKQVFQNMYFGIATYFSFFLVGAANYQIRLPYYQSEHYIHSLPNSESNLVTLKITEVLKPDRYNKKYIARVLLLDSLETTGKLLLSIRKDSLDQMLTINDILSVSGHISKIAAPHNPHQFNYAAYMRNQDVYGQVRTSRDYIVQKVPGDQTLRGAAETFRKSIIHKLDSSALGKEELTILQALVLGERRSVDKQLYAAYADAGVVHLLAVSGLHVGILYVILLFLLRPLAYVPKGNKLQHLLIVILLWGFALITGLSPSVTRAVTMFSFFGIAQLINRPTNSINTLFLSLFFLLLVYPKWLLHVGFQLSYLAVFFILWLQPEIYNLYKPKYYLDKLFWGLLSVTVAAQLGVAPLSIFYFNQFPGLFLIANLVILPFLSIIVGLGILIVLLAAFDSLPSWLADLYSQMIATQNEFIMWLAAQDTFLLKDIHFSGYWLFGSYLVLISTVLLFKKRTYKRLLLAVASILVLLSFIILNKTNYSDSKLIVFHKTRETLVGVKEGSKFSLFTNKLHDSLKDRDPIASYRVGSNCGSYTEKPLKNFIRFRSMQFLIIDSTAVYPRMDSVDYVLLRGSPKLHLDRLIDSVHPRCIISDGSNYTSFVARWRESCRLKKLPFHHTGDRGAFIIE